MVNNTLAIEITKERAMSDTVSNYPHMTREDMYFEALEAFIRTSADYLDVDMPHHADAWLGDYRDGE